MTQTKSFYAQHQDLLKLCIMAGQKRFPNLRLFPAQVGSFYVKRMVDKTHYKFEGPYKIGTNGQADLNGWITINESAFRIEVEVKSGKTLIKKNSDQDKWRNICLKMGVIHIVATSPEQFVNNLEKYLKGRGLL